MALGSQHQLDVQMSMLLYKNDIRGVDMHGAPVTFSGEMTANDHFAHLIPPMQAGELIGHLVHLHFRDPNRFFRW